MRKHFPQIIQGSSGEIIHDGHSLAVGQQALDEVRPDEPSAAGYQNVLRVASTLRSNATEDGSTLRSNATEDGCGESRAQGRRPFVGRAAEPCARISAL